MSMSMNDDVDDEKPKGGRNRERDDDDDLDERDRKPKSRGRDDDEDDGDDEDDEDADKSEADLRAELKRIRADLKKSNAQGARRRRLLREERAAKGKLDDGDDDEDEEKAPAKRGGKSADEVQRAVDRALRKRNAEVEAERVVDRKRSRVETALTSAGITGRSLRMLAGEVDLDDLTIEKDGTVDGLDEVIDELRADFPQLFAKPGRRRGRINGGDDRDDRDTGSKKKMTASQRQAAQLGVE